MKKIKMQIMLSTTVIVLVFLGLSGFISLSYNYFMTELKKQIIKDNQVIGSQLLEFVSEQNIAELSDEKQNSLLQNLCDNIKLPNGGFVCAVSPEGSVLAFPGQKSETKMTFASNSVSDLEQKDKKFFSELHSNKSFEGLFVNDTGKVDILAVVPVEKTNIRLLVHQNLDELEKRVRKFIRPLVIVGIFVSLLIGLVTYLFTNNIIKRYEHELEKINKDLTVEKHKSDKLLLNILPARVANDLKESGQTTPESFENVSVYFSDIVGFTKISADLEPKLLIDELDDIFTGFDNIMEKNCCERIKTIGDAYLAVCGMPERNENHAYNIVKSATEIIQYLETRNRGSEIQWKIRIGIDSGKVVGGVVGVKKYIYDVFGDTINTASRMESKSEPMKINVSEATYQVVKDKFSFIAREPFEVKGKGKMMMYFLTEAESSAQV